MGQQGHAGRPDEINHRHLWAAVERKHAGLGRLAQLGDDAGRLAGRFQHDLANRLLPVPYGSFTVFDKAVLLEHPALRSPGAILAARYPSVPRRRVSHYRSLRRTPAAYLGSGVAPQFESSKLTKK